MTSCGTQEEQAPVENPLDKFALKLDTDILFFNGKIQKTDTELAIVHFMKRKRRDRVLLVLVTYGGEPGAAYKMARCLQECYKQFSIFIPGPCKSAGTLIAVGANQVVMGDFGELGPLDIQMAKRDELGEMQSALVLQSSVDFLMAKAFGAWEQFMLDIVRRGGQHITFRMATKLAVELTTGLFDPIMAQIDPAALAESSRAAAITWDYGTRLLNYSQNITVENLLRLATAYPDHGFVVDRQEAMELFTKTRSPSPEELTLEQELGAYAREVQEGSEKTPMWMFATGGEEKGEDIGNVEQVPSTEERAEGTQNTVSKGHAASSPESELGNIPETGRDAPADPTKTPETDEEGLSIA